ncbi:VOC family protein [Halioglobus maricola]|uniref:VOC family protein n=1 Tax=Halioglobus maricola TaxID=2601894 RepID=UPI0014786EF4|nr:VOC family protein [Halioglobus maricola]
MIEGFSESVVIVRDARSAADNWLQLSGWAERHQGAVPGSLLRAWGLADTCAGREVVLQQQDAVAGRLRLIELAGCEQEDIRPNPQTWDCGALLDLNVRVADMGQRQREFRAANWRGPSDPVAWRFGEVKVSEWLAMGEDGLAVALIERLSPPLPDDQLPDSVGPVFNSSQVVADMAVSLAFYEQVLGFDKFLHIRQPLLDAPGENPLGIPHNLVSELDVEIAILSPGGSMDGSVELIKMHGLEGRQFAARSRPPNLGLLGLRFPVQDAAALAQRLAGEGVEIPFAPTTLAFAPYGSVLMFAARAPEGAWLEFYQLL